MTTLLNIRRIQIKREVHDAGFRILFVIGLLVFLVYTSYFAYQKTPYAFYLTTGLFTYALLFQIYRKDKLFIYHHIHHPHWQIYSEYFALTFPFAIPSLLTMHWYWFPILLASLSVIPFLKFSFKQKTYFKNISSIIPASNFEWISGFRKFFIYLIPLYILAVGYSWVRIVPFVILWFITSTITSFYFECEPLHILKERNLSASQFLKRKLFQNSKYLLLLAVPILTVNTMLNVDDWLINLLLILVQLILLCFAVCFKYSCYQPTSELRGNNIITSLVSLCALIPYLLPVPLIMLLIYYPKAKQNLTNYLND